MATQQDKMQQQQHVARLQRVTLGGWALAGVSGVLLAAAYPGMGWWWLALVAYVPLLRALSGIERVRSGFLLGWLTGTVLHGLSFHWLHFTMKEMSGLPAVAGWAVVVLHAVAMGLHQAAFAAIMVATRDWRRHLWWPVWVGMVMLAVEVVVPWQFPWFLGNVVYPAVFALQAADVVGIVGVSGLVGGSSAALMQVWERRDIRSALVVVALFAGWFGYGWLRTTEVDAAAVSRRVKVGVIQHNPSITEKKSLKPGPRLPMLRRALTLTKSLPLDDLDMVVWPEGTLPFFYVPLEVKSPGRAPPVLRKVTAEVQQLAASMKPALIFGTLRMSDRQWKQRARNAAVVIDGGRERYYDKHILVPFGEYLPGRDLVPALEGLIPGVSNLGAGQGSSVMAVRGVKVGLNICYEALFAGFMWSQVRDSDFLLNLTDDVWFGSSNAPELHLMVQLARAVELRRPMLRVTATGISALIDANGRVTMRTPIWQEATRVVEIEVKPSLDAPFRWWGPWLARAIAIFVVLTLTILRRRQGHGLTV